MLCLSSTGGANAMCNVQCAANNGRGNGRRHHLEGADLGSRSPMGTGAMEHRIGVEMMATNRVNLGFEAEYSRPQGNANWALRNSSSDG